jgi:hypothetical protein
MIASISNIGRSASAIMWQALRLAGVGQPIPGYGRLLTLGRSAA